jgi:hypothetical protein
MQDVSVPAAKQLNCSCNPACDESIYDVTISMAQWPSSQYMNVMAINPLNTSLPYKYDPVNSRAGGLHVRPVLGKKAFPNLDIMKRSHLGGPRVRRSQKCLLSTPSWPAMIT